MATRSRRTLFGAAALLSAALIVGGAVVAYRGYEQSAGPGAAVRHYFSALKDGDAPRALSWGQVPDGPHSLLTSTVLKTQQRIAPIVDFGIDHVDQTGSRAVVHARYSLNFAGGAVPVTAAIHVDRRNGTWRLRTSAIPIQLVLSAAKNRATVAGGRVPQTDTLVFPGAAPITFDTPYLELDPARDSIGFGSASQLDVAVRVSRKGRVAARAAVGQQLTTCLTTKPRVTCPLPSDRYVPGSLKGTLKQSALDALAITLGSSPDGVIELDGTVAFTGSYRKLSFANVAKNGRGTAGLKVHARAYAVAPLMIAWNSP